MSKQLLLGDEAIAQAALDAGLSGVYAYPGTPSTEITEYIQMAPITTEQNIHNRWCTNEKTAMEAALGMSFVGKRALVCMKHVGMNVAADCFVNSAITGVKGGLIVVAADDPSMHSSQNEQDSRFYGDFSLIPMYEPSNQQEAYDMVYDGFEFSEKLGEPVLMRMVTRLAHSRSGVERKEQKPQNGISFSDDPRQFILLPGNARKRYKVLLARQDEFIKASEESPYNKYTDGPNKKLGIIACGIGYNYLMENYPEGCEYPVLKIGQYPLPKKQILQLVESCDEILVLEDGQPFVEKQLKGYLGIGIKVKGRLDGTLSQDGELNPDSVARAAVYNAHIRQTRHNYIFSKITRQDPLAQPMIDPDNMHKFLYDRPYRFFFIADRMLTHRNHHPSHCSIDFVFQTSWHMHHSFSLVHRACRLLSPDHFHNK